MNVIPIKSAKPSAKSSEKAFELVGDWLYRRKVGGAIYVRRKYPKDSGIPELFKSTGETKLMRAREKSRRMMLEWEDFHSGRPVTDRDNRFASRRTVGELIDAFMEKESKGKDPGTVANYRTYFAKIREKFGRIQINAVDQEKFDAWIEDERKKPRVITMKGGKTKEGPPRKTFSDYAKNLNALMTFAYKKKWATHHVRFPDPDRKHLREIQAKKKERGIGALSHDEREILELKKCRVLTRDELDRLYAVMDEDGRDQFVLAYTCFMRLREAIKAPWSEIDLKSGVWSLPAERVKTRRARAFRVSGEALERLRARRAAQKDSTAYVFPGWSIGSPDLDRPVHQNKTMWRTAKKNAGIKGRCRWHDIRHTALTHALLGDDSLPEAEREAMRRDPLQVSEYAGVSMRTIQKVYLHGKAEHTEAVSGALSFTGT